MADLTLKDSISLDDMIAVQNAEDAPRDIRRLMALHFFRRVCQPSRALKDWQKSLKSLRWLEPIFVGYFGENAGGFGPDAGPATQTLVVINILPKSNELWRVYIGFDQEHGEFESAFDFLSSTRSQITYLGLCHGSGFMENYRKKEFGVTYHPMRRTRNEPESLPAKP